VRLDWIHKALESQFGALKREEDCFTHFGVNVTRCPVTCNIEVSQRAYLMNLKCIVKEPGRRAQDTPATKRETTDLRSLISGIAWVGVTHPGAQAAASMLQNALPSPKLLDIDRTNTVLLQLQVEYAPLLFRAGMRLDKLRIFTCCDSSLGNSNKYSQGGFVHMVSEQSDEFLVGPMIMMMSRSVKSKRVAASTSAAETLAMMSGVESGQFLQTWLAELLRPKSTAAELLAVPGKELPEHSAGTDCNDLNLNLLKPSMPQPAQKSLTLYLASLRESKENGSIKAWVWVDTDDDLANGLTKLENNGAMLNDALTEALTLSWYEPRKPYQWNGLVTVPGSRHHMAPPKILKRGKDLDKPSTSTATSSRPEPHKTTTTTTAHYTTPQDISYQTFDMTQTDDRDDYVTDCQPTIL
jgi:hypothetical protein